MPIMVDYDPEEDLILFRHLGNIPDEEFLASYSEFFRTTELGTAGRILVDLTETTSTSRSSGALGSLSDLLRDKIRDRDRKRKVAVIAPKQLSFGLARMYEALSDRIPWEFAVFRDSGTARAWLTRPGKNL